MITRKKQKLLNDQRRTLRDDVQGLHHQFDPRQQPPPKKRLRKEKKKRRRLNQKIQALHME